MAIPVPREEISVASKKWRRALLRSGMKNCISPILAVLKKKHKGNPMPREPDQVYLIESAEDLLLALEVRLQVFVEEQGVTEDEERDQLDTLAVHVLGLSPTGKPLATGRLVQVGSSGKVGRVAVLREARGEGWGRRVMLALEAQARRLGLQEVKLDSQVHAIPFYQSLGYQAEGPVFLDCRIEHRLMRKVLSPEALPAKPHLKGDFP
jgi:predicted GNAT family N-acyltransferase